MVKHMPANGPDGIRNHIFSLVGTREKDKPFFLFINQCTGGVHFKDLIAGEQFDGLNTGEGIVINKDNTRRNQNDFQVCAAGKRFFTDPRDAIRDRIMSCIQFRRITKERLAILAEPDPVRIFDRLRGGPEQFFTIAEHCTVFGKTPADQNFGSCKGFRNGNGSQIFAKSENIISHFCQTCRQNDCFQRGAATECPFINRSQRIRQGNIFQCRTTGKNLRIQFRDGIRDHDFFQCGAIQKGFISNTGHGIGNDDLFQVFIFCECHVFDSCDPGGNRVFGQVQPRGEPF